MVFSVGSTTMAPTQMDKMKHARHTVLNGFSEGKSTPQCSKVNQAQSVNHCSPYKI
jgi:hypothetical protein